MTRLLTALAIIGPLLVVLWLPWQFFLAALIPVGWLAWNEYARLARNLGPMPPTAPGALLALAIIASFAFERPDTPALVAVGCALIGAAAALREGRRDPGRLVASLGATLAGLAWIGLLGCQLGLRRAEGGTLWLLLLYGSVAVGDSAAYYGGSTFGRHKLAPYLSPKKTVEGSLAGLVGSALTALLVAQWVPVLDPAEAVVLGALLGLVGQAGDLIESSLKRAAGVKDSSTLLPGHGGVLDRIDAHLPAGGLLWLVVRGGWLG